MSLELRDVTIRYEAHGHALTAVDRVSLTVPKGGTLGLVGESGCGKSSLARGIVGLVPLATGQLLVDGEDYTSQRKRDGRTFRRKVQMIFQDPYASLNPRMTVGDMIGEGLRVRDRAGKSEATRVLELVGLTSAALERYPHQFSGGQRQRVAIARALAVGPEVIINDEVTSALDVSVQATILNLLRDLQHELGLSYVFISHDLSTVRLMSDVIAVMYLGRVIETGPTDQIFHATQHPYTRALLASIPDLGSERRPAVLSGDLPDPRRPPAGCRFHTRCPVGPLVHPERTTCISKDPQLTAALQTNHAACHFASPIGHLDIGPGAEEGKVTVTP